MSYGEVSPLDPIRQRPPRKFTPERIQQIKNLVERGKSREEIAELIGVTVGSLQVTCSRLGISLRRPTFNNGVVMLRRNEVRLDQVPTPGPSHGGDSVSLDLMKERLERNSQPVPTATVALSMQYRGEERTTELPLTQDLIGQLALEAAFRNLSIGELIGDLIVAVLRKDMLETLR